MRLFVVVGFRVYDDTHIDIFVCMCVCVCVYVCVYVCVCVCVCSVWIQWSLCCCALTSRLIRIMCEPDLDQTEHVNIMWRYSLTHTHTHTHTHIHTCVSE